MNRHERHKRPVHRAASIDGIVTDGRRLGVPTHRSYQPSAKIPPPAVSLGQNRRPEDGFHPLRQSPGGLGAPLKTSHKPDIEDEHLLDEPIMLDDIPDTSNIRRGKKKGAKQKSSGSRWKKIIKRSALGLLALVIATGGYFGYKFYETQKDVLKGGGRAPALAKKIDINQLKGEGDGRINILVLGVGGENHDGGDLTDTIMLASIDPVNNTTALLSVPRDLWVKIPEDGYQKINAAYFYGKANSNSKNKDQITRDGLKKLDATLAPILGVTIHYHALIDFTAFQQMVDAVSGIDVNVPEDLYDPTIAWENDYNPYIAKKETSIWTALKRYFIPNLVRLPVTLPVQNVSD